MKNNLKLDELKDNCNILTTMMEKQYKNLHFSWNLLILGNSKSFVISTCNMVDCDFFNNTMLNSQIKWRTKDFGSQKYGDEFCSKKIFLDIVSDILKEVDLKIISYDTEKDSITFNCK